MNLFNKICNQKVKKSTIDLHLHSTLSDGTDSLEDIIVKSERNGLKMISFNDHDNIIPENYYNDLSKKSNIKILNGIETSTKLYYKDKSFSIHILGYKVKDYPKVYSLIEKLKEFRKERNLKIFDKMKNYFKENNIKFDIENFEKESDFSKISRIHFAKILVDLNIEKNIKKAFKKYLSRNCLFYVEKKNFDFEETISLLKSCFSKVFLAHPFISFPEILVSDKKEFFNYLFCLINKGIDGIEAFYPEYKRHEEKIILNFCLSNNIPFSCGSDYHGLNKPYVNIGEISKNLNEEFQEKIYNYFVNL